MPNYEFGRMTTRKPVFLPVALCAVLILSGCASKPAVVDDSPLVHAAIVTSDVRNNGFKGLFASDGIRVVSTVADMQRVDDRFKYTGSIMGRVGGKQNRSEIVRLDKRLEWYLDNRKKRYVECELGGCRALATYQQEVFGGEEYEPEADESCVLKTTEHSFSIKKTGVQRDINGFPAEEYSIDWQLSLQDTAGKKAQNHIAITLWTTPVVGEITEAVQLQNAFDQRYRQAVKLAMSDQLQAVFPDDVLEVLTKYLFKSMSEADQAQLTKLIRNEAPITGYPVSRKIQWDGKNETCAAPPEADTEDEDRLNTSSIGGLLRSVGKQVIKQEVKKKQDEKRREIELAPLFSYIEDVKKIEIGDVHESQLSVPGNFKLDNRN